ncbi:inhibin beta A chain isoform X3 [Pseudoliparis swirei]|uniref:inhibin beta A chain isoform X3 n=1 Tax=Pseudoliparis swirei TaxID=2059687 RepID=UPI0024BF0066|nr:inhibin beta A chain isoform X3 [Pseudoliparis swirei]
MHLSTTFLFVAPLMLGSLCVSGFPGCSSCGFPATETNANERLMIAIVKHQLLEKLHLKERPNITQTIPRPALLTALRKLDSGRFGNDGTHELEKSILTKNQGYEILSFADLSKMRQRVAMQPASVLPSSFCRNVATVSRCSTRLCGSTSAPLRTAIETLAFLLGSFSLQKAFLDGGQHRLHLEVSCIEGGKNLCSLHSSADTGNQPFLVAQVRLREDHSKHTVRKRSLHCGDDVSVCCKREFYIKFKDIQWNDWIIAPDGYHMNYCMGQCPQHLSGSPGIASSFHATVFSQLKVNGINTAASSCCVATERRPLSMVYFNSQHSIVKKDIPDMIVESCGCT